jgi:NTP pyrophosphatase (non-canonical NTP hydrolase)
MVKESDRHGISIGVDVEPEFFSLERRKTFLLFKLLEECGELVDALAQFLNREDERGDWSEVVFEMADVINTLDLLAAQHDLTDELNHAIVTKRRRIIERHSNSTTEVNKS